MGQNSTRNTQVLDGLDRVRADVVHTKWLANLLQTDGPLKRLLPNVGCC